MKNKNKKNNLGFTIIEVVISITIFVIAVMALFQLFNAVFKNIRNNRAMTIANNVALEQLEIIRGMDFDDIKTDTGWTPAGPISSVKNITKEGITLTVRTDISWEDDPYDYLDPIDTFPFDYKKIRVRVNWSNPVTNELEEISMNTSVVPSGLEGLDTDKGGVYVTVFDSQGTGISEADVSMVSDSLGYELLAAKTDVNGNLWIPNLDPSDDYHIEVTKTGYSSAQTYPVVEDPEDPEYNPDPTKSDVNVIVERITKIGFSIDVLGTMNIKTVAFDNPDNIVVNQVLTGGQTNADFVYYDDDIFMVWEDSRNGGSDIYMQKFSYAVASGSYSRVWASDVLLINNISSNNPVLEITDDGDLFLVWNDSRDGDSDVYLREISKTDGSFLGSEYKVNDDSGVYEQLNADISSDQDGNLYIVWEDNRDGNWEIYAQNFNSASQSFWGSDLLVNASNISEQLLPKVILDREVGGEGENQNSFYVLWQSNDSGDFDIMLKKFDLSGNQVFSEKTINEDTNSLDQQTVSVDFDGSDYLYVVWSDYRNSQPDIYMQKLDKDGNISFAQDIKINDDSFEEARRFSPDISYGSDSNIYVTWEDSRNGDAFYNVYSAKIDSDGNKAWTYDLILAGVLESIQINSSVLTDTRGNAIAIWEDDRSGDNDLYLSSFADLGDVTNGNIPITIISVRSKGSYPNPEEEEFPEFLSIPKYSETLYSDAVGNINISEMEWGSYTFETEDPYVIKSIDLPSPIAVNPGEESNVVINVE